MSRISVFLVYLLMWLEPLYAEPAILQGGTWGLETEPDPFTHKYPTISYLPAGTILFKTEFAPLGNEYVTVLTHNGYWVQILRSQYGGPGINSLRNLALSIPSDAVFFHRSVLCLNQTNRFISTDAQCEYGEVRNPVGEGWVFRFEKSERPDWLILTATLDGKTQRELTKRGWDSSETKFEVKMHDLERQERRGNITMLNRKYPLVDINNRNINPVVVKCGAKEILGNEIRAGLSAGVSAEAEASFFNWISTKLGIALDVEAGISKTRQIEIDTTKGSYLYYSVGVREKDNNREYIINVEKQFECETGAKIKYGNKITEITFEIDYLDGSDPVVYIFNNPEEFIEMDEKIYKYNGRPIFISINDASRYADAINRVMDKLGTFDRWMAEFILMNMNYSCPSRSRKKCSDLSN